MKKYLNINKFVVILITSLLWNSISLANSTSSWGYGDLKLSNNVIEKFIEYIHGKKGKSPSLFAVSKDGNMYNYYYCTQGNNCGGGHEGILRECAKFSRKYANGEECSIFARYRTIKWDNGNGKNTKFKSKMSDSEISAKLKEIGFYDGKAETRKKTNLITKKTEVKKPLVKKSKKSAKIYSLNETRPIALKWDGYADLIAGTIEINEKDYKGEINLTLPNKDGSCKGAYSLQEDGRGTWQISCTNNMGAAGSLEWVRDGGTTGKGRDYKDKKVQFTVANKS